MHTNHSPYHEPINYLINEKLTTNFDAKLFDFLPDAQEILFDEPAQDKIENYPFVDEEITVTPEIRKTGNQNPELDSEVETCFGTCLNCPWYCDAGVQNDRLTKQCSIICQYCPWSNEFK